MSGEVDKIDQGKLLIAAKNAGEYFDSKKQELGKIINARKALLSLTDPNNDLCEGCKKKIHDRAVQNLKDCGVKIDN